MNCVTLCYWQISAYRLYYQIWHGFMSCSQSAFPSITTQSRHKFFGFFFSLSSSLLLFPTAPKQQQRWQPSVSAAPREPQNRKMLPGLCDSPCFRHCSITVGRQIINNHRPAVTAHIDFVLLEDSIKSQRRDSAIGCSVPRALKKKKSCCWSGRIQDERERRRGWRFNGVRWETLTAPSSGNTCWDVRLWDPSGISALFQHVLFSFS